MSSNGATDSMPIGTVTFLFTDIEGSTRLWEEYPKQTRRALVRHDELVEIEVSKHAGKVVRPRGEGDSRFAVFARASDGLLAAVDLQKALYSEAWPTPSPLRVRIALHTGEADLRDGDYYGSAVNRCARLRSTAHGGQTLITQATYALVSTQLPEGVKLLDLGEHNLKDLAQPEHIFQVAVQGLSSSFPPLNTIDNRPNNLPIQRSTLVGREKELAAIVSLLSRADVGLLTITGPGGAGKTRLALQAAAEMLDRFEDGAFLVNLAPITDPKLVVSTIAQSLGAKDAGSRPILDVLKEYLRSRRVLLVLDNFEHLLPAANEIADLLSSAPGLKLLATSREALHLYGEHDFPVPPLSQPDLKHLPPLEELSRFEAVSLFAERARAVRPGFSLTTDNARAVAEITARLDGLPLAIELAAARVVILSPQAILTRLESRLKLLTSGARDLPARQQTLRGAIEWSYSLLTQDEQKLFRRLSVFVGGCTFEAMEAVCNANIDLTGDTLDILSSLISKSLVWQVEIPPGSLPEGITYDEPRFTMLETIREYASEKLAEAAEADEVQRKYADFFIEFVELAGPRVPSDQRMLWQTRINIEYDNVRAVLGWLLSRGPDDVELAMRMSGRLPIFWDFQLRFSEGRQWGERAVARGRELGLDHSAGFAGALWASGLLAFMQGEPSVAQPLLEESIALSRTLGDRKALAFALWPMGMSRWAMSDYEAARDHFEEGVAIFRQEGPDARWGLAMELFVLGDAVLELGDEARARSLYEESRSLFTALGDRLNASSSLVSLGYIAWLKGDCATARSLIEEAIPVRRKYGMSYLTAISLASLSQVARCEGEYDEAIDLAKESLSMYTEIGEISGIAWALYCQGYATYYLADYANAEPLLRDSLRIERDQGHRSGMVRCLAALASLAARLGQDERAARLFGAADVCLDTDKERLSPADRADYDRAKTVTHERLGEQAWQSSWQQGQDGPLPEAAGYVLRGQQG